MKLQDNQHVIRRDKLVLYLKSIYVGRGYVSARQDRFGKSS